VSADQNMASQEAFGQRVIAGRDVDAIDELVSPSFVDHDPAPDQGPGAAGLKDFWRTFLAASSDLAVDVDHIVADTDSVAIAYRASGTQDGDFLGVPATGKSFDVRGLQMGRFEDGKLVERWGSSDQLGILQQIGAEPGS
jgi:steroid delta-isomerase-like uncharacterized protein